jgi:hypothetical protein
MNTDRCAHHAVFGRPERHVAGQSSDPADQRDPVFAAEEYARLYPDRAEHRLIVRFRLRWRGRRVRQRRMRRAGQCLGHQPGDAMLGPRRTVECRTVRFQLAPLGLHPHQQPPGALRLAHHAGRAGAALQPKLDAGRIDAGQPQAVVGMRRGGDELRGHGGIGRQHGGDIAALSHRASDLGAAHTAQTPNPFGIEDKSARCATQLAQFEDGMRHSGRSLVERLREILRRLERLNGLSNANFE